MMKNKRPFFLLFFSFFISCSLMGFPLPNTFNHHSQSHTKDFSLGLHLGWTNSIRANYSLKSDWAVFCAFNYNFIPYKSKTIPFGTEFKKYPNIADLNIGITFSPQTSGQVNRYLFSMGIGSTLLESTTYSTQRNRKHSEFNGFIMSGFLETSYLINRKNFEHFITGMFISRYFHNLKQTYFDNELVVSNELDFGKQMIYEIMFAYGVKYKMDNVRIGIQAGIGIPVNKLEHTETFEGGSTSRSIGYFSRVLNLSIAYSFNLGKTADGLE